MVSEDEDLEFLRLAALQSRKRKLEVEKCNTAGSVGTLTTNVYKNYDSNNKPFCKRNKTIKGHRGVRGTNRNNISNSRVNTNLIAIPIAADSTSNLVSTENPIKISNVPNSKEENNSKFNRYDHSDQSDSESDTNVKSDSSDNESAKRSERGDSLDRLMDELENEIAGGKEKSNKVKSDSKSKEKPKNVVGKNIEKKSSTIKTDKNVLQTTESIETVPLKVVPKTVPSLETKTEIIDKKPLENNIVDDSVSKVDAKIAPQTEEKIIKKELPPLNTDFKEINKKRTPPRNVYRPKSPNIYRQGSQKRPQPPLSPLRINTEVLNTITMAPLSPRSAAFVLQNREILAKRKLSPCRRSISSSSSSSSSPYRSPSRKRSISPYSRPRFAYSPIRRYSPPPRRRSISPLRSELFARRRSPRTPPNGDRNYKRRSFSPRPVVRSPSPSRRVVKKRSNSPKVGRLSSPLPPQQQQQQQQTHKSNVYCRLGYKSNLPKRSTSKYNNDNVKKSSAHRNELPSSPKNNSASEYDRNTSNLEPKENSSPKAYTDPVLEARKRKFESNKPIEVPDGIIKIKLNKETVEKENEILSETEFDNNTPIADLWSTDESDNENEGRFKNSTTNVNILKRDATTVHRTVSLEKSNICTSRNRKSEKSSELLKGTTRRCRVDSSKLESSRKRKVHSKSNELMNKKLFIKKDDVKKLNDVDDKNSTTDIVDLKSTNSMRIVVSDIKKPILNIKENRKVTEVLSVPVPTIINKNELNDASNDSFEAEIVYENETLPSDTTQNNVSDDLRTELSRRRAERKTLSSHSHGSLKSGPPTRLLRTAFQEMSKKSLTSLSAFQKPTKGLKKERIGKLPIHMRLGTTCKNEDEPRSRHKSDDDDSLSDYSQSSDLNSIIKSKSSSKLQNYKGRKKRIIGLQV